MTSELPVNQRRDTACPLTRVNETRKRVKRWPDIIGIGAPKCGTGTIAFFDCHSSIVFREAEGRAFTKSSTFRSVSVASNFVRTEALYIKTRCVALVDRKMDFMIFFRITFGPLPVDFPVENGEHHNKRNGLAQR